MCVCVCECVCVRACVRDVGLACLVSYDLNFLQSMLLSFFSSSAYGVSTWM